MMKGGNKFFMQREAQRFVCNLQFQGNEASTMDVTG